MQALPRARAPLAGGGCGAARRPARSAPLPLPPPPSPLRRCTALPRRRRAVAAAPRAAIISAPNAAEVAAEAALSAATGDIVGIPRSDWLRLQAPARYLGNEWGAIHKPWDDAVVRFALAYPEARAQLGP
jgi:hypothetical protein